MKRVYERADHAALPNTGEGHFYARATAPMSLKVMAAVWQSALPSDEKFVAVSLADWADDTGYRIYPSQDYIAWKVGKTSRAVRDTLKKLQERGVLVQVGRHYSQTGGHGGTVEYRLDTEALPKRVEWVAPSRAAETSYRPHPEVSDTPVGSSRSPVGSFEQPGRKPTSYDPLSDPPDDPPTDPLVITQRAKKRVTVVDEPFIEEMISKHSPVPADRIRDEIADALGHTAALKRTDLKAYVRNWLGKSNWNAPQRPYAGKNGASPTYSGVNGHDDVWDGIISRG